MFDHAAITENEMTLADTLTPVALLLGGVPTLTVFVMTAARYVASGTF
jgi:bacterioferritin (cytochrome b1)